MLEMILKEELRVKVELEGIEVSDSRRYRMYALLRVGYRFWHNSLHKALSIEEIEEFKEMLEELLKPEKFREIVEKIERLIKEDKATQIDGIRSWVEYLQNLHVRDSSYENVDDWLSRHSLIEHKNRNGEELLLISLEALGHYNEFARRRGSQHSAVLKI